MYEQFIETFLQEAKRAGLEKVQFHMEAVRRRRCVVSDHQLDRNLLSDEMVMAIDGCCKGRLGSAFTETADLSVIPRLVETINQVAAAAPTPFREWSLPALLPVSAEAPTGPVSVEDEVEELLASGEGMYAASSRVQHASLDLSSVYREVTLIDNQGQRTVEAMTSVHFGVDAVAREGSAVQTASYRCAAAEMPDYGTLSAQVARESAAMLGAGPCRPGKYPAVIRSDVFLALLDAYLPAFHAENVQKEISLLAGKEGARIAAPAFHLCEEPVSIIRRRLDDEGIPTQRKALVKDGYLRQLIYNQSAAEAAKTQSTGNGFRQSHHFGIATAGTNFLVPGGRHSLEELLSDLDHGILVTACDGVFAGANPVSGDFSLIAKGWLIEKGRKKHPVMQFTMGGNILSLLQCIRRMGNDHTTDIFAPTTSYTAPSILVEELLISS